MSDDDREAFVYDAAGEGVVLRACLADDDTRKRLVRILSADEFLVTRHSVIFHALRAMTDAGLVYSPATMRRFLSDASADSATVDYLGALEADATLPKNLDWYVQTLAWDATRARTLKGPIPELFKLLRDPQAGRGDVLTAARQVARALEDGGRRFMHRPEELYREYRAEVLARRVKRNVFPLGAGPFDSHLTEGFMPGRTTVTAGLPGAGKSTVWLAFAILLAKAGRRVLYGAWEMDPESLLDVGVAHMTGIDLTKIVQGTISDEEAARIDKAARWITSRIRFMSNAFFTKTGTGKPSNARNLDLLEGYLAESGADVAIYDLWQRMLPFRAPDDEAGALFRMQAIHQEYGIHGVIVHQLRLKDVEARADKRPTREAIKGSGAYVEVADLIFGIHRDAQFKAVADDRVETICLKQRKGRANWAIRWDWDGATCRVANPEEVPFDPGLEAVADAGDIGRSVRDMKDIQSGKKPGRRKAGRRE